MKCSRCDYEPRAPGANWGIVVGPKWVDVCRHVNEQRRCPSCSEDWWQEGLDSAWDIDGCARAICPECAAEGVTLADCRMADAIAGEDSEAFRGREAAEFERESMARIQAWR